MSRPGLRTSRARCVAVLLAVVAGLAVVLASPLFGEADPEASFRPPAPAVRLVGACSPLPDGIELEFPHQVSGEGQEGDRHAVRVHVDLVDPADAEAEVVADLEDAGFVEVPAGGEAAESGFRTFRRDDYGVVAVSVEALWDDRDDAIVRGVMRLRLPAAAVDDPPERCRPGPAGDPDLAASVGSVAALAFPEPRR